MNDPGIEELATRFGQDLPRAKGDIRACLQQCPEQLRELLLPELIREEIEFRYYPKTCGEYQALCPEYSGLIAELFTGMTPVVKQEIPIVPAGYRPVGPLGKGAMSNVCLAYCDARNGHVALKIAKSKDEETGRRFCFEAKALVQMNHENIVQIYESGKTPEGFQFLALELMNGGTLEQKRRAGLTSIEALRIVAEIAAGLAYIHKIGILHRDLSLTNVLFNDSGMACISDFGFAKDVRAPKRLTSIGRVFGTPDFRSHDPDYNDKSEVEVVGLMLKWLLAGMEIPRSVDDLHKKCISMQPEDRPTPEELQSEALQIAQQLSKTDVSSAWSTVSDPEPLKETPKVLQSQGAILSHGRIEHEATSAATKKAKTKNKKKKKGKKSSGEKQTGKRDTAGPTRDQRESNSNKHSNASTAAKDEAKGVVLKRDSAPPSNTAIPKSPRRTAGTVPESGRLLSAFLLTFVHTVFLLVFSIIYFDLGWEAFGWVEPPPYDEFSDQFRSPVTGGGGQTEFEAVCNDGIAMLFEEFVDPVLSRVFYWVLKLGSYVAPPLVLFFIAIFMPFLLADILECTTRWLSRLMKRGLSIGIFIVLACLPFWVFFGAALVAPSALTILGEPLQAGSIQILIFWVVCIITVMYRLGRRFDLSAEPPQDVLNSV